MKVKWSQELLQSIAHEVRREVLRDLQSQDSKIVLDNCLKKVLADDSSPSSQSEAYKVYYAVAAIALLAQFPSQALHTVPKLERIIKTLLLRNKVKPRKSLLAHVYAHVAQAISYFHSQQGNLPTALWEAAVGFTQSQSGAEENLDEQRLHYAQLLLERGSANPAAEIFHNLATTSQQRWIRAQATLMQIRALRLADRFEESELLLQNLMQASNSLLSETLEWELALHKLRLEGPQVMADLGRRVRPNAENIAIIIKQQLWLRAHRSQSLARQSFSHQLLKRRFLKMGMVDQRVKTALKVYEIFASLEDTEISFDARLALAAHIHTLAEKLDIETRLLALAALLRWLARAGQRHLALAVLEDYQSLNLRLSLGRKTDLFDLIDPDLSARKFLEDMHIAPKLSLSS